jgi:hypothetical protein
VTYEEKKLVPVLRRTHPSATRAVPPPRLARVSTHSRSVRYTQACTAVSSFCSSTAGASGHGLRPEFDLVPCVCGTSQRLQLVRVTALSERVLAAGSPLPGDSVPSKSGVKSLSSAVFVFSRKRTKYPLRRRDLRAPAASKNGGPVRAGQAILTTRPARGARLSRAPRD